MAESIKDLVSSYHNFGKPSVCQSHCLSIHLHSDSVCLAVNQSIIQPLSTMINLLLPSLFLSEAVIISWNNSHHLAVSESISQ